MSFWNKHDLALMEIREEMIILIEEYNKTRDINSKNYHRNLDSFFNRRLVEKMRLLTKLSLLKTIVSLNDNSP